MCKILIKYVICVKSFIIREIAMELVWWYFVPLHNKQLLLFCLLKIAFSQGTAPNVGMLHAPDLPSQDSDTYWIFGAEEVHIFYYSIILCTMSNFLHIMILLYFVVSLEILRLQIRSNEVSIRLFNQWSRKYLHPFWNLPFLWLWLNWRSSSFITPRALKRDNNVEILNIFTYRERNYSINLICWFDQSVARI